MERKCIVHYDFLNIKEPLREVTDVSLNSQKENKQIRERLHCEQCNGIPDRLDKTYYMHPECFKKFNYARTLAKRKGSNNENTLPRGGTSQEDVAGTSKRRGMFADICMLCKKKKIKVNGKEYYPKKILTFEAEKTLKLAVKMKNDEKLNILMMLI